MLVLMRYATGILVTHELVDWRFRVPLLSTFDCHTQANVRHLVHYEKGHAMAAVIATRQRHLVAAR